VVQAILGLFFLASGGGRTVMPIDFMAAVPNMEWTAAVPPVLLRFIGIAEVFGALGVVLPAATRIKPWLTPLAAAGLALIMVLAGGFHVLRHEPGLMFNAIYFSMAAFVAWGRWKAAPISSRH
jgi:hypothetical protein